MPQVPPRALLLIVLAPYLWPWPLPPFHDTQSSLLWEEVRLDWAAVATQAHNHASNPAAALGAAFANAARWLTDRLPYTRRLVLRGLHALAPPSLLSPLDQVRGDVGGKVERWGGEEGGGLQGSHYAASDTTTCRGMAARAACVPPAGYCGMMSCCPCPNTPMVSPAVSPTARCPLPMLCSLLAAVPRRPVQPSLAGGVASGCLGQLWGLAATHAAALPQPTDGCACLLMACRRWVRWHCCPAATC